MTIGTSASAATTAMAVLFEPDGSPDAATSALHRAVIDTGATSVALRAARRLTSSTVTMIDGEVAGMARTLLDVDVGAVLVGAWRRYADLREAARRTAATPGTEEILSLATHRITSTHLPCVDLRLDGARVHTFRFRLEIVLDVSGVAAVVREGGLVGLQGGECAGSLFLYLDQEPVAQRHRTWEPLVLVSLEPPVDLVPSDTTTGSP
jgi:hypothetical protein